MDDMPTLDGVEVKIMVDRAKCIVCGQCVKVCPCEYLAVEEKKVVERKDPPMGCLTCGHCAAICPQAAISVESADFLREDIFEFSKAEAASYENLYRLLIGRRSIRQFKDQPVPADVVTKILEAAQTAPAGLPPSAVKVCVLDDKAQVHAFAFDFLDEAKRSAWLFSKWGIWVLRPFMTAEQHKEMREKIAPLYQTLLLGRRAGMDYLFYDAPLAMVFLTAEGDPVNPTIAATYAMIAAESLGLGSCMIGTVAPMIKETSEGFKDKYRIPKDAGQGLAIIFGYPLQKFQRGIRRRFAGIFQPEVRP
jgi:nitroreductase/Pyruvate/2-oxoacid:ferredoxin oxidoreductase delta subunit